MQEIIIYFDHSKGLHGTPKMKIFPLQNFTFYKIAPTLLQGVYNH